MPIPASFITIPYKKYNTRIELFPTNLVAGILGFGAAEYFTLQDEPEARQTVEVKF